MAGFVGLSWDTHGVTGVEQPPADLVRLGLRTALRHGHGVTLSAVRDILAVVLPEAERRVLAREAAQAGHA